MKFGLKSVLGAAFFAVAAVFPSQVSLADYNVAATKQEPDTSDVVASLPVGLPQDFASGFACNGTIMHQSHKGAQESPLSFWLGVQPNNDVAGMVTNIGAPLDLPQEMIRGRFLPRHDQAGKFTGGQMVLDWPYASRGHPVELGLMRETFIRVGPRVNGIARTRRQTTSHTYAAGRLSFDPASHPSLHNFHRISFISATCVPQGTFPPIASSG